MPLSASRSEVWVKGFPLSAPNHLDSVPNGKSELPIVFCIGNAYKDICETFIRTFAMQEDPPEKTAAIWGGGTLPGCPDCSGGLVLSELNTAATLRLLKARGGVDYLSVMAMSVEAENVEEEEEADEMGFVLCKSQQAIFLTSLYY